MSALFVSDLHLDESKPLALDGFARLLRQDARAVDAIYILGDLFEVWVGDDDDGPVANQVRDLLAAAAGHCELFVMPGNRDFLFGERFAADTGATLLPDPVVAEVDGTPLLLAHGDAYCTGDAEYQRVRTQLRSAAWQRDMLAKPLAERRTLAAAMRTASAAANANKSDNIMDVTREAVAEALADAGARTLVHGHTHRPGIHDMEDGRRRIVLGDWNRCAWKLILRRGEAALTCFPLGR